VFFAITNIIFVNPSAGLRVPPGLRLQQVVGTTGMDGWKFSHDICANRLCRAFQICLYDLGNVMSDCYEPVLVGGGTKWEAGVM
jgi:hypothetical protein